MRIFSVRIMLQSVQQPGIIKGLIRDDNRNKNYDECDGNTHEYKFVRKVIIKPV